jgi:hypothetical protein
MTVTVVFDLSGVLLGPGGTHPLTRAAPADVRRSR